MINLFNQCPACQGPVVITECRCTNCNLEMRGEFQLNHFSRLSDEQLTFIRVFLSARGNLSEMERVLGISYPTVRNKLEEINAVLDENNNQKIADRQSSRTTQATDAAERQAILQKVADGEISTAEALQKLQARKGEQA